MPVLFTAVMLYPPLKPGRRSYMYIYESYNTIYDIQSSALLQCLLHMPHSPHTHLRTCGGAAQLVVGSPHGECLLALGFELQPEELCSPQCVVAAEAVAQQASTLHYCLTNRTKHSDNFITSNMQPLALLPPPRSPLLNNNNYYYYY